MTRRTMLNCMGLVVMIVVMLGAPCLAQESDDAKDQALLDMIETHDKALSGHDLEGIMSTYAPDGTVVLMGTGQGERWVGKEEIADAYTHFFMDFDPGTLSTECTWHSFEARGDVAWLMLMCNFTDYWKNIKREYGLNMSVVVEKIDARWYIRAFHYSNLTDPD